MPCHPLTMDPTASTSKSNGDNSSPCQSKRQLDNGNDVEFGCVKRRRFGGEMKPVAEMALVLSAMGLMRGGGRKPSEAEVELMVEARRKLVGICEEMEPKDVVRRDWVGRVIEDLGLSKDRKLGVCGPKLSISEKLEDSNRKMEESKKFSAHKTTYTSQLQQPNVCASAAFENRGVFSSRFPGAVPYSSVPFSAPTAGHVSVVPAYLTTNREVKKSISSSGFESSHLGRSLSAQPRVEGAQSKVEGANGGTLYSSQVRASSSANLLVANPSPWSIQAPSASSTKSASENKATNSNPVKVTATNGVSMFNMSSQAARDRTIRPSIANGTPGSLPSFHQTLPGMNIRQPSFPHNHHSEIAKSVQSILHPLIPECPSWTPPSKDYMNKALTCQMCKVTTNEVSAVLVCDSCEKGYHVNCIQLTNQNGIPRGEWHCKKCLSNGKPLPPKYGRVARNANTPRVPSTTAGAQVSQEKKLAALDPKVALQKIKANESPAIIQSPTENSAAAQKHVDSDAKFSLAGRAQLNNSSDKSVESCGAPCGPAVGSSIVRSVQQNQNLPLSTNKKVSHFESKPASSAIPLSPASSEQQNVDQAQMQNCAVESAEESHGVNLTHKCPGDYSIENIVSSERSDVRRDDQINEQENVVAYTARSGPSDHSGLLPDGLQAVEWDGDVLRVLDGKQFYQSCRIDGVIYKVHDYALFRFSPDKSAPSKLLAMWEDSKTGSKWLIVRKCYFPSDLPEIVGRPYTSGSNEVFESNRDSIVMSSLLEGPCEVLIATKFKEEIERRNQSGTNDNTGPKPIFLCKWFYDEVKGTFQPSSS